MSVQEAQAALDAVTAKKKDADYRLSALLKTERDLTDVIGRAVADGVPSAEIAASRKDRDQVRSDIEDLQSALDHLTADVAKAEQGVKEAKRAEARGVMREQVPELRGGAQRLAQALQDVSAAARDLTNAGSKARNSARVLNPEANLSFATTELVARLVNEHTAMLTGGVAIGASKDAVADEFAGMIADAEVLGGSDA